MLTTWGMSLFPEKSLDNKAFYFQNQLKLFDRIFLTGGVRIDDNQAVWNRNNL